MIAHGGELIALQFVLGGVGYLRGSPLFMPAESAAAVANGQTKSFLRISAF
jgi:hypothetical protein